MVGGTSPLGLDTLRLIGIVVHYSRHFILSPITAQPPAEGEDEYDESNDESSSESSLPLATEHASPPTIAPAHP